MSTKQPSKRALYIKAFSTQYRPLLWLFAAGLLLLGLLCARATYLQPDPILQLVLGWVTLFLLLPVLPTAFVQQQCWLDAEQQQLWRWRSYAFSDIKAVQLYQLQITRWHQFNRNRQAEDTVQHYLAYLELHQPNGAQLILGDSTDRKELQQVLQQCAQAIDCKLQDFSNTTQKSLPKGSEFNFMRVLVLLVIFILLNILYFLFVL